MIKREDLLAKGYTAEQTTELLDMFHNDQNATVAELRIKNFQKEEKIALQLLKFLKICVILIFGIRDFAVKCC